jgi:hypothetical protein
MLEDMVWKKALLGVGVLEVRLTLWTVRFTVVNGG